MGMDNPGPRETGCLGFGRMRPGQSGQMQSQVDAVKRISFWKTWLNPERLQGETCQRDIWDPQTVNFERQNTKCKILQHVTYWTILIKMSTSSLLGLIKTRCWRANGRDNKLLFVVVRASEGTRTKEFKLNGLVYVCALRELTSHWLH